MVDGSRRKAGSTPSREARLLMLQRAGDMWHEYRISRAKPTIDRSSNTCFSSNTASIISAVKSVSLFYARSVHERVSRLPFSRDDLICFVQGKLSVKPTRAERGLAVD